jgi:hypothetical protein
VPIEQLRPGWIGGLAEWTEGETAFLSIAFTWRLPEAYERAVWYRAQGYRVQAGGPGVFTRKAFLNDVAEIGGDYPDAIVRHNPQATMASRGCPVGCWFCIVPKMEGRAFTLLPDFPVRPVLSDNNLSALPVEFQQHIISRYVRENVPLLDAQSGFEPATFDEDCFDRWRMINRGPWRFAFDEQKERDDVQRVMRMLATLPPKRKRVYVLLGNEPMASCLDRLYDVIGWGGEPHAQPYIKLNALEKRPQIRFDWTEQSLRDVARWANRRNWRYASRFEQYRRSAHTARDDRYDPRQDSFL